MTTQGAALAGAGALVDAAKRNPLTESPADAGIGFLDLNDVSPGRAHAMVWADTYQAKADNSKNNTLLKAVK